LIGLVGASGLSHAGGIPEPPAIIFGSVAVDGQPVVSGIAIEARVAGRTLDRYTLGSDPTAGGLYVLRVPLVGGSLGAPMPLDAARIGDEVAVFAGGLDTGSRVDIDARAQVTRVDLQLASTSTTTTTMPIGATCGDPVASQITSPVGRRGSGTGSSVVARVITASDALFALKSAIGSEVCLLCVCDVNGSGDVTASDALILLKLAVGQSVPLACPPCT